MPSAFERMGRWRDLEEWLATVDTVLTEWDRVRTAVTT